MVMQKTLHRAWAEIDLDALVRNYRVALAAASGGKVMCVVKADAYGHGAVMAARALARAGARHFGVAAAEEALQLRRGGISGDILLLGEAPPRWAPLMARHGVAMAVGSAGTAAAYSAALAGAGTGTPVLKIHLKIDTGMCRMGFSPSSAVKDALAAAALPGMRTEGVFTHLAAADMPDEDGFTAWQLACFLRICDAIGDAGLNIPLRHCANSAGVIFHPDTHLQMVRPGIMLYGGGPRRGAPGGLFPVMALRSRIVRVAAIQPGHTVGYGRAWTAGAESGRPVRVATVSIGYGDGLPRALSGRAQMLVRGQRAPQIGRICMDMCMLDVSAIPKAAAGDAVTVFGCEENEEICAGEVAELAGTIDYEVMCAVSRRVPRIYLQGGRVVKEVCYIGEAFAEP